MLFRSGKGIVGTGIVLWMMGFGGYAPFECCGNQTIKIEGFRKYNNAQLVAMLKVMVHEHVTHKVINVAEADRAFPPRFWQDKKQTEALLGLWQDEKLGIQFVYDTHYGGVDKMLRQAAQVIIVPHYVRYLDTVWCELISKIDLIPSTSYEITDVSKRIFPYYLTAEPVD